MKKSALFILVFIAVFTFQAATFAGEDSAPRSVGIAIRPVTAEDAKNLGLKDAGGLFVEQVKMDSAAAMAGIVAGDVITGVNGKPVATADEFYAALESGGARVTISILRDGWEKDCVIKFAAQGKQDKKEPAAKMNDRAKLIKELKQTIAALETEVARLKKTLEEIEKKKSGEPGVEKPAEPKENPAPKREAAPEAPNAPPIKETKAKPYLGIMVEIDDAGLKIADIEKNSPAEKSRLKVGDILTAAGDFKLASLEDLSKAFASAAPGDAVDFSIIRNGQNAKVMVILGKRPDAPSTSENEKPVEPSAANPPRLGISAEIVDEGGLLVTEVEDDSPAAKAGLQTGDVLLKAGKTYLKQLSDLRAAMSETGSGGTMVLVVKREDKTIEVKIEFGGK